MYSQKIIARSIRAIESATGLTLRRYSILESRFYSAKLEELLDPGGPYETDTGVRLKRAPKKDEWAFITNERLLSKCDFLYWAERHAHITDWTGTRVIPFKSNIAQRIMVSLWAELEEKGIAIMLIQLKARQLGASTGTMLAIAHRVQYLPDRNAYIASSDPDKTRKMGEMMSRAWDRQPWFLKAKMIPHKSGEIFREFPGMNSRVTVQHGTALSGIGRGDTPSDAAISEIPDFHKPEEHLDNALFNSMHENPSMFLVLESTAAGRGDWWHRTWLDSKEGWAGGSSDLCPVFLPFFVGRDIYPTKTWLKKRPVPKNWVPDPTTVRHVAQCEEYVQGYPILKKHLGADWHMDSEQQWWWEFKYKQAKRKKRLNGFLQEVASNDNEAFQLGGMPLVPADEIRELENERRPLVLWHGKPAVFALMGNMVPESLRPLDAEIDWDRPSFVVEAKWDDMSKPRTYQFVPLIHDVLKWRNRLYIWEWRKQGFDYAAGQDFGYGEGKDRTTFVVIRKATLQHPAEQVAEFASDELTAMGLLPWSDAIGALYSHVTKDSYTQCGQIIEINFGGNDLQQQLRLMGWSNFHRWEGAYDDKKRRPFHKMGWLTNARTRPGLFSKTIYAIRNRALLVHSPHLIDELGTLQVGDDDDRIDHARDSHDDRFIGAAMAYCSLHAWESLMNPGAATTYSPTFDEDQIEQQLAALVAPNTLPVLGQEREARQSFDQLMEQIKEEVALGRY